MQQAWQAARDNSPYFGEDRPQLPAGLGGRSPYLIGHLPGDYGFDPLGLWATADENKRRWYVEAELLHARWAMLAVVGCLVPELLDDFGASIGEPVWWKVRSSAFALKEHIFRKFSYCQPRIRLSTCIHKACGCSYLYIIYCHFSRGDYPCVDVRFHSTANVPSSSYKTCCLLFTRTLFSAILISNLFHFSNRRFSTYVGF
jgi:hypothetical protein